MKDVIDQGFEDIMDALKNPKIKCYTTIILDRSGSMQGHESETVDEFNNQLNLAKEQTTMDMFMSLVTFSYGVDKAQHWLEPVTNIKPMKLQDYKPDGGTALLDAIGFTLSRLMHDTEPESRHLVFVMSDGGENHSKEYNGDSIKKLLDVYNEDKRWTITYFGCNVDKFTLQNYGFNMANVQMCKGISGEQGVYGASATMSRSANSRTYYNTVASGMTVNSLYGAGAGSLSSGGAGGGKDEQA